MRVPCPRTRAASRWPRACSPRAVLVEGGRGGAEGGRVPSTGRVMARGGEMGCGARTGFVPMRAQLAICVFHPQYIYIYICHIGTYVTQITWSLVCVFVKLQVSLIRIQHEAIQFGYIIYRRYSIEHEHTSSCLPYFVCATSNICVVFQCQNLYILAVQNFGTV